MTIERLQARKQELTQQREQVIANMNAISGALQLVDDMISEEIKCMAEKEKKPVAEVEPEPTTEAPLTEREPGSAEAPPAGDKPEKNPPCPEARK